MVVQEFKELSADRDETSSPRLLQRGFERTCSRGRNLNVLFFMEYGIFVSLIIILKQKIKQFCVCLDGRLYDRGELHLMQTQHSSTSGFKTPQESSLRSQELSINLQQLRNDGK